MLEVAKILGRAFRAPAVWERCADGVEKVGHSDSDAEEARENFETRNPETASIHGMCEIVYKQIGVMHPLFLCNKHIKTLSFLQEIVEENKKLKARIQELEVYLIPDQV